MSHELPTVYQQYIHLSRYSRWLPDKGRRETWQETVTRYFDFFEGYLKENHKFDLAKDGLRAELEEAVLNLEVLPSMRAIMTAGPALARSHIAGYNCAFAPPVTAAGKPDGFAEAMFILLNGTGFGYTVESHYCEQLPVVPEKLYPTDTIIVVGDSKLGWAKAYKELIHLLYAGQIPKWDVSKVRPAGAKLKTFGGRASGPGPLVALFDFTVTIFKAAKGRRLSTVECNDIFNMIGDIVVSGGVRRSAEIGLSDLEDDKMRYAKSGNWYDHTPWRRLANISATYNEKPAIGTFMREWLALYDSKSGERGIFNRYAGNQKVKDMLAGKREPGFRWGTNPCGEILLRPWEFCNLSTVICRPNDSKKDLMRKIRLATILGTIQSCLTDFKFLSSEWRKNCEEERLLGVSLCGMMDNPLLSGKMGKEALIDICDSLRIKARAINSVFAKQLGIPESAAITTVKPEGTCSQLVAAASGIHANHNPFYIRTVRSAKTDPVTKLMIELGFPHEDDKFASATTTIFSFPIKVDPKAIFRNDRTAIEQLEHWLIVNQHYTEHNPSITVYVKEDEWIEVANWVYNNFDKVQGVSFLPHSDHSYEQAPYQDCTAAEYDVLLSKMPKNVDWSQLSKYELDDETTGVQQLACVSGVCSI